MQTSQAPANSSVMLRRSRFDMREDETPELEDLPDLEAERAISHAIIADALKRDPAGLAEVVVNVVRSFAESGRYSAGEVNAAIDELLEELEAHNQTRP